MAAHAHRKDDWVDFGEYARIFKQSWIVILLFGVAGFVAAYVATELKDPVYQSSVELVLEQPQMGGLVARDLSPLQGRDDTFLHTQIRILQSDLLRTKAAEILVAALRVEKQPEGAQPEGTDRGDAVLSAAIDLPDLTSSPELLLYVAQKDLGQIGRDLGRGLSVNFLPRTRILTITTRSIDPHFAAAAANCVAAAYSDYVMATFASSAERSFLLLGRQTEETGRRVKATASALVEFRRKSELSRMLGQDGGEDGLGTNDISQIRERLAKSKPEISVLEDEVTTVNLDLAELGKRYKPKHPEMQKLTARLGQLEERIRQLKDRALAQWEQKHAEERTAVEYSMLEQDLAATRQLHELLVGKLKEIDFSKDAPGIVARILKQGGVPSVPSYPKKNTNWFLGTGSGLLLGVFLAFLRARAKLSFVSLGAADSLSAPVTGALPHVRSRAALAAILRGKDASSPEAEAFKALRTSVESLSRPGTNIVLITSPERGEGKSTVASGLARSFAHLGRKVLLMDGDLRRGGLHRVFRVKQEKGLSEYLTGDDQAVPIEIADNLWFLPCGSVHAQPAEVLASQRMEELMIRVSQDYHVVLLDAPPILPVTDASLLSAYADLRFMVVRHMKTKTHTCSMATNVLHNLGYNFNGIIINDVAESDGGYYGYYQRYYRRDD